MKKKLKKVSIIIAFIAITEGVVGIAFTTGCGINQQDLSLTATTSTPNDSNHGEILNNEISFNTYDNTQLTISLVYPTSNANLQ
jgi:flagellar basal body-associated protein FliL